MIQKRWRHAIHEAGHLLAGVLRRRTPLSVTVDPSGQSLVLLTHPPRLDALGDPKAPLEPGDTALAADEIRIKWGGNAAEHVMFGHVVGDRIDRQEIGEIAQRCQITNVDALRLEVALEFMDKTDTLVALANALLETPPPSLGRITSLCNG